MKNNCIPTKHLNECAAHLQINVDVIRGLSDGLLGACIQGRLRYLGLTIKLAKFSKKPKVAERIRLTQFAPAHAFFLKQGLVGTSQDVFIPDITDRGDVHY